MSFISRSWMPASRILTTGPLRATWDIAKTIVTEVKGRTLTPVYVRSIAANSYVTSWSGDRRVSRSQKRVLELSVCGNCSAKRQIHTENDKQFLEYIKEEIQVEKESTSKTALPRIKGFNVETNGPEVKLTKKVKGEIVTVEFNVNNSVDSVESMEDDTRQRDENSAAAEMVSQPSFKVTIEKEGHASKLCLQCEFVDNSDYNLDGAVSKTEDVQEDMDAFEIVELAIVDKEWNEKTYSVNADLLDGSMYDMLMMWLEDRGINHGEFADQLTEFSTAYEHSKYINLLESLRDFIQKQ